MQKYNVFIVDIIQGHLPWREKYGVCSSCPGLVAQPNIKRSSHRMVTGSLEQRQISARPAFSGEWLTLAYGSPWMFFQGCDRAPAICVRASLCKAVTGPVSNLLCKKRTWHFTPTSLVTLNSGTCITDGPEFSFHSTAKHLSHSTIVTGSLAPKTGFHFLSI